MISVRPILFSGPMVRAILDGRKNVTRRVVHARGDVLHMIDGEPWRSNIYGMQRIKCPYGAPGDRLWVRETFALSIRDPDSVVERDVRDPSHWDGPVYREGYDGGEWTHYEDGARTMVSPPWRPSIFMPRWASRITLEIIGVRVERLHAITELEAIREGVTPETDIPPGYISGLGVDHATHRGAFRALWDKINGKRAPWDSNPWVWRIEFRRVT